MNVKKATKQYEEWLAKHTTLFGADLELKHKEMAKELFPFLRATFYRWAQLWPEVCSDLSTAPTVLSVGDLHVENFGTWRDIEGRLIWGVNDLDEAYPMPYTNDLVRLATSADLAIAANHLAVHSKDACKTILEGYTEGINAGGSPFVLAEQHKWLRTVALSELRDPVQFWQKMDSLTSVKEEIPASAKEALENMLPERGLSYRIARRIAGLGSLGRQRFVAIANWRGGKVAREAKALLPSACVWAGEGKGKSEIMYQEILSRAVRCPDPFVQMRGHWIVRRLAPDCSRIELASLPKEKDETRLMYAMGWETANIHLGTKEAVGAIKRDLKKRSADWLHAAAKDMAKATTSDWEDWKKS